MRRVLILVVGLCFLGGPLQGQVNSAAALLSAAMYEEEVSGDLGKAIELYQEIIRKNPNDKSIVAKAQSRIDGIRQKTGKAPVRNVFTDPRDGHIYSFVNIGTQTWMAENLAYMPWVNPKMKQENGIWVYDYDGYDVAAAKETENYKKYGCLYDWPTAMGLDSSWLDKAWPGDPENVQGICPPGWHLPSDDDWKDLERALGMPEAPVNDIKYLRSGKSEYQTVLPEYPPVGRFLKADHGWIGEGVGDNKSGFNALPAGTRRETPPYYFSGLGSWAYFWSATVADSIPEGYRKERYENVAWSRELPGTNEDDYRMFTSFEYGQSVRCVQNRPGILSKSPDHGVNISTPFPDKRSEFKSELTTRSNSYDWSSRYGANNRNTGFISGSAPRNTPGILWSATREMLRNGCLVTNEKIYVPSLDSLVYCFDAETGQEIWQTKVNGLSVTLHEINNGILYITAGMVDVRSNSFILVAINSDSGDIIWETEPGKAKSGLIVSGGTIIYSRNDGYLVSLDLASRDIIWEKRAPHDYTQITMASDSGLLVIGSRNQNTTGTLLDVIPNYMTAWDLKTGHEKWEYATAMSITSSPVIYGNRVFFGCMDRNIYSLDLQTGLKSWRFYTGNKVWSTASVAYDRVFITSGDAAVYGLDACTGRLVWQKNYPVLARSGLHAAIADSLALFSGRDSCLHAVNVFTGNELWSYKLNSVLQSNPIIYNGRIYYVMEGTLYAIE